MGPKCIIYINKNIIVNNFKGLKVRSLIIMKKVFTQMKIFIHLQVLLVFVYLVVIGAAAAAVFGRECGGGR